MSQFEEPEILAELDRSFGENRQRLVFEKGEFRGRPTYALRVLWQTAEGQWRWQPAKPSSTGKTWQALSLKARELRALGLALTAEADELERMRPASESRGSKQVGDYAPTSRKPSDREQQAIDRFDREHPTFHSDDESIPF